MADGERRHQRRTLLDRELQDQPLLNLGLVGLWAASFVECGRDLAAEHLAQCHNTISIVAALSWRCDGRGGRGMRRRARVAAHVPTRPARRFTRRREKVERQRRNVGGRFC